MEGTPAYVLDGFTKRNRKIVDLIANDDRPFDDFRKYDLSNFFYSLGDDPLSPLIPFSGWHRQAYEGGYYLYSEQLQTEPSPRIDVRNGKTGEVQNLVNLSSYNYLGIACRNEVKEAASAAIRKYGLGASGSPILSGTFDVHVDLAEALAKFKNTEASIIFPTGYSTNVGFISGLMRPGDTLFLDQYSHASIVDGSILAKSKTVFFRHNNPRDLERKIANVRGKKLVVVEGVYSMDGDICDLPEILDVCERYGARIMVDEAHSDFIFGPNGRGIVEHFGVADRVDFHVGTMSKTLGGQGGFLCGSQELIDYVSAYGRSRLFSCNVPPALAVGMLTGLHICEKEPELRERLWRNASYLRERFHGEGVDIGNSNSHIMPVMVNDDAKVFAIAEKAKDRGLFVQPAVFPAVRKNKSRLRISVSAMHSEDELDHAAQVIATILKEEGIGA